MSKEMDIKERQAALAEAIKKVVEDKVVPYFNGVDSSGIGQEFVGMLLDPDFFLVSVKIIKRIMTIFEMVHGLVDERKKTIKERDQAIIEYHWLAKQLDSVIEDLRRLRGKIR